MAKRKLILSLAKVLISAAWADGNIDNSELNCLKDLLFSLEEMHASDWAELEIYLADPIDPHERAHLLEELQHNLRSSKDKQLALDMLHKLVSADGQTPVDEQRIAGEIERSILDAGTTIFDQLGNLLKGPIQRRESSLQPTPNREEYLEDFLRNRIYYHLRRMSDLGEIEFTMPDDEVRKLSLAGGLLARVATADSEVSSHEQVAMAEALQDRWNLSHEVAGSVAALAISEVETGLDFFRLSREFFDATSREERLRFVEVLFQIGYSDGDLSHTETEEIRHIANGLKLSHREFIDAKLSAKPQQ
jgi:uncharacterized tellurite resistance protein B-like protein